MDFFCFHFESKPYKIHSMGYIILNVALAAIPSFALVLYFYLKDKDKREPPILVLKAFILGFFAVLPAILLELALEKAGKLLGSPGFIVIRAFIVVALVEEGVKLLIVRLFLYDREEFDEVTDGIVYTITASLGFAFFENILYSFGPPLVLIIRGITAVPLHATASGILGYYIGRTKLTEKPRIATGLSIAVLIHGTYDLLLFSESLFSLLVIPLLIGSGIALMRLFKKAMTMDRDRKPE